MNGVVYILKFCKSGRYYVGSTSDLDRRLRQHGNRHTLTTHRFGEFSLVFQQTFPTLEYARKIELVIKKWKRKDFVEKIIQDGYIKKILD